MVFEDLSWGFRDQGLGIRVQGLGLVEGLGVSVYLVCSAQGLQWYGECKGIIDAVLVTKVISRNSHMRLHAKV